MRLRGRLRKLERAYQDELITIPQTDGSVKRFPQSALREAFIRNCDILRARADGEPLPEPHPLQLALQNAARREPWHESFYDMLEAGGGPVEDLSE